MSFINRTDWANYPDETTPIMAGDLLRIEKGVADAHGRTGTFSAADLVNGGVLNIKHNLGEEAVGVIIKNDQKKTVVPDDIIDVDENNVSINLSYYLPITGTWRYRIAL